MDISYGLWKLAAFLVQPSNCLCLVIPALLVRVLGSRRVVQASRRLLAMAGALLFLFAFTPASAWLLMPLERRFAPFDPAALSEPPSAIIILGGALSWRLIDGRRESDLGGAVDRVRLGAQLATRFPNSAVIVSGGEAFAMAGGGPESDAMAQLLTEFGVDAGRIVKEAGSRRTDENASLTRGLITDGGQALLVTSAFHMPRAVATFRGAGLNVIAAPTDWRVGDTDASVFGGAAASLERLDLAAHEYVGLAIYRLTGRTRELFPGP